MPTVSFKSPLHQMTQTTGTCLWNDSAAEAELAYAHRSWRRGCHLQSGHRRRSGQEGLAVLDGPHQGARAPSMPTATRRGAGLARDRRDVGQRAALLLRSSRRTTAGTGACRCRPIRGCSATAQASCDRRSTLTALAPNIIVKIPATLAGHLGDRGSHRARDQHQRHRIVHRAAGAGGAEAVERGLRRRERDGGDISTMGPVCTIMVGRLDDWLKVVADKQVVTRRSRVSRVGGRRGVQAGLSPLPRARVSPRGCCQPRSATTCTGANSSAATS